VLHSLAAATGEWGDLKVRIRDGRMLETAWAGVEPADKTKITIGQDITERKRAEEVLGATSEQLRALSARL
jgi:PAS domain-containing protein